MRPTIFMLKFWFACDIMNKTGDNLPDKSEFNAHLKNENSQKRSHKTVMKGRITYE